MNKRKPNSMKHLREVGVAGIIVASLAAVPGTVAASSVSRATPRTAPSNLTSPRRTAEDPTYQDRLSVLSAGLESDIFELEFKLSRLAQGHEV